jgi:NADH dehydrogenase [ubiquinone] 1 alpha subcomplex assembly factor 5
MPELFDTRLRAMRRDRSARNGPELFLFERIFDDLFERVALINRSFERALLIGCPVPDWHERLEAMIPSVEVRDPGPLFARAADGLAIVEDDWQPPPQTYDLVLSAGTLDTVNDLPLALLLIARSMTADGLLIGVLAGADTLPKLRSAMRAADAISGSAAPHVHPRVEASAVPALLASAGFFKPVIDVERIAISYPSFERLVADLRGMAATNVLAARSGAFSRRQAEAARLAFAGAGDGSRTLETFELIHFAAWAAAGG